MADLQGLRGFAAEHDFGLTAPLTNAQVRRLAEYWLPQMRFHWDERFHPVTLDDMFDMVEGAVRGAAAGGAGQLAGRGAGARRGRRRRCAASTRRWCTSPTARRSCRPAQGPVPVKVRRVLNDGTPGRPALRLPEVDGDTVVTHGASFGRANQFFGPLVTLSGTNTAAPGDPFLPRADEPDPGRARRAAAAGDGDGGVHEPARPACATSCWWRGPTTIRRTGCGTASASPAACCGPRRTTRRTFPAGGAAGVPARGDPRRTRRASRCPSRRTGWRLDRTAWNAVDALRLPRVLFLLRLQRLRALPDRDLRQRARGRRRGLLPGLRPGGDQHRGRGRHGRADPGGADRDHHLGARGVSGRRHHPLHRAAGDPARRSGAAGARRRRLHRLCRRRQPCDLPDAGRPRPRRLPGHLELRRRERAAAADPRAAGARHLDHPGDPRALHRHRGLHLGRGLHGGPDAIVGEDPLGSRATC